MQAIKDTLVEKLLCSPFFIERNTEEYAKRRMDIATAIVIIKTTFDLTLEFSHLATLSGALLHGEELKKIYGSRILKPENVFLTQRYVYGLDSYQFLQAE